MDKKSNDPYHAYLRKQYLEAMSVIHDLEVKQAYRRLELKQASDEETAKRIRRDMYTGRKQLAKLNKQISAFYTY